MTQAEPLDPRYFRRQDESPDADFYSEPRLVVHIDDAAIAAVTAAYEELLPEGGAILDLMSSWRSHLPDSNGYTEVIGLGLNAEEMADNPQLDGYVVHDLNADPTLPFADAHFAGTVCTVSAQYLTRPVEVFREVNRVLQPGAPFILTYSNRCFPTKAISAWLATTDQQHANIIATYFHESGNWGEVYAQDRSPRRPGANDPLYVVWAYKRDR
jgi:SAM-dependent methyltransferase